MRVLVTPDYRTLSQTAAELVIKAIRAKPTLRLGLPTGSTPLGMYEEIVKTWREQQLDFSQVQTFNLDEYVGLAVAHPRSYHTYMREKLFAHVNIPAANIHIPSGGPGVDLDAESRRYEAEIAAAGGIDLLVAGVGANGHIGFNEPGSAFDSRTRVVDLSASTIRNAAPHFGAESPPAKAITMGIGTILESRRILLIASGAAKADAVERALRGRATDSVPASALQLHQQVIVIVDEAACGGSL